MKTGEEEEEVEELEVLEEEELEVGTFNAARKVKISITSKIIMDLTFLCSHTTSSCCCPLLVI